MFSFTEIDSCSPITESLEITDEARVCQLCRLRLGDGEPVGIQWAYLPVLSALVEATSAGNAIVQAFTLGYLQSLSEGRQVVARSFPLSKYQPRETESWMEPYQVLKELST